MPEETEKKKRHRVELPNVLKPRLLDVRQAAAYLGKSYGAFRMALFEGAIPVKPLRIGKGRGRMYFDVKALDSWIDEMQKPPDTVSIDFDWPNKKRRRIEYKAADGFQPNVGDIGDNEFNP